MASTLIPAFGPRQITVPSGSALATFSSGLYTVENVGNYQPVPGPATLAFSGLGYNTTSAYSGATTVIITSGASPVYYNVGTAPVVFENQANYTPIPVGTLNASGTLTLALMATGCITSTTAAAVAGTLDTGAVLDAKATFAVGDTLFWSVINTGATNAFTVTASAGHTVVGSGIVAPSTSARFETVKTAANTFVTYRLA